jgi:ParB family chromosome partitioning protein
MRNIKYREVSSNYDKIAAPNPDAKMRPSIGMENSIGEFFYINVDNLEPYSKQARKSYNEEEMNNLAETIAEHGVTQPLNVIKTNKPGFYEVISGERRLRAAKIAGLNKVPCIIRDNDDQAEEIAVIENIQRSDLHPIELASAYSSLLEKHNYGDQANLAKKLGVGRSHLSETLNYINLPEEIKVYLLDKNIRTRSLLRSLVACANIEKMREYLGITKRANKIGSLKSVLRISLNEGNFQIQDRSLKKLSSDDKKKLKTELQKIINQL